MLTIDSGWGFGPLAESVPALAEAGVQVLAVAGRDRRLERRFRELAARTPRITPFGYTDRIPALMAAADPGRRPARRHDLRRGTRSRATPAAA